MPQVGPVAATCCWGGNTACGLRAAGFSGNVMVCARLLGKTSLCYVTQSGTTIIKARKMSDAVVDYRHCAALRHGHIYKNGSISAAWSHALVEFFCRLNRKARQTTFHMPSVRNRRTWCWTVTCFDGIDFDDAEPERFGVLQVLPGNVQPITEEVVFFTCQPVKTHTQRTQSVPICVKG